MYVERNIFSKGKVSAQGNQVPNVSSVTGLAVVFLLLPANGVWGKVICLQACVCPQGGCLLPEAVCSRRCMVPGVSAPGGCMVPEGCLLLWGGGVCSWGCAWSWVVSAPRGRGMVSAPGGGCLVETPLMATAAGGMHPTGMHSCLCIIFMRV